MGKKPDREAILGRLKNLGHMRGMRQAEARDMIERQRRRAQIAENAAARQAKNASGWRGAVGKVGSALGAAGGIEAVFTIQALLDQKLPPTAGFENPDPECCVIPKKEAYSLNAEIGISNSLAFGVNNATLVFRRNS